ncbi:MAG: NAD(+)/NADH kinase [Akkermansiaceae bacterium]
MKVGIIANRYKSGARSTLLKLRTALDQRGISSVLETQTATILDQNDGIDAATFSESCDLVAVLGGDGTMLNAANQLGQNKVPVAGINIGTLGFLTTCTDDEIDVFAEALLNHNFNVIHRALLKATVRKVNGEEQTFSALNEITLSRGQTGRLITLDAWVDDELLNHYRADGLIVATATGSTAYSLSAGGPLIDPKADVFVITPICPHSLTNRSLVISDRSVVDLASTDDAGCPMLFTVDGREIIEINPGDKVRVESAQNTLPLIQLHNRNFYATLRQKLGWR